MSVPLGLLAILSQGPCYGAQVRAEFDRRTGQLHQTNIGQVFRTLERLERDGAVVRAAPDARGHVLWSITDSGRERARSWLAGSTAPPALSRDELAVKIAVATTLPGVDAAAIVRAQQVPSRARVERLHAEQNVGDGSVSRWVMRQHELESAEAELRWLDRTLAHLIEHPPAVLELSDERPRRGRPPASDLPAESTDSSPAPS